MEPSRPARPVGVTILGIAAIAVSTVWLIGSLLGVVFVWVGAAWWTAYAQAWMPWVGGFAALWTAFAVVALLAAALLGALGIVAGAGALQGRAWAWGLGIALLVLNGLSALGQLADQDVGGVMGLAVSAIVIWYLFQPDVKRWFGQAAGS